MYKIILQSPDKFISSTNQKVNSYEKKLLKKTEKYLHKLQKQEQKLQRQLAQKDSNAAKQLFGNTLQEYKDLQNRLKSKTNNATDKLRNTYSAKLDSLTTELKFLNKEGMGTAGISQKKEISEVIAKLEGLQSKLNSADEIKKYISQRKKLLQDNLQKFGMLKQLKQYQKQAYYYHAQLSEYKKLFNQPNKIEAKVLQALNKIPQFKAFFATNSTRGNVFNLPNTSMVNNSALQTRASLTRILQSQFGNDLNVARQLHQNQLDGQVQLSKLKNKITDIGGSSADIAMPNFKVNSQKTKSFKQRLEFGSNLQSTKSDRYFPATTDVSLSVGYKLNDKSIVGIGMSYKIGLGKNIENIHFSSEGIGFRSFLDIKLKKSFWISGGAEMNYKNKFNAIAALQKYNSWQTSALLGISKKYKISKKLKGNLQFMYDFLYNNQLPVRQPFVYRIGYTF